MKLQLWIFFLLSLFLSGEYFLTQENRPDVPLKVKVYQSRNCGCCKKWNQHLRQNGFIVNAILLDDVTDLKINLNLPMKFASCHTAIVNGYIIEGHVPAQVIHNLLKEKSPYRGLSVPGMPIGSPGMEGSYRESFEVIAFGEGDKQSSYMKF